MKTAKNIPLNSLKKLYQSMLKIRYCEESFVDPILAGQVKCPVHLCSGQEGIAVGISAALRDDDFVFGNHRSHGHFLAKGGSLSSLVAEVYGKESGCSNGRGGSMHLVYPQKGILGTAPIVAGTISLALGSALAARIRKNKSVTVSFFGDGATGEGVVYESLNFAALKKLPIIFVCENNFYSTHMPIRECRPNVDISKIALPFGIRSFQGQGNDVLKVYALAKKAVSLCRQGAGPVLIELFTYRQRGHVGADDTIQGCHTDIRPKQEISAWLRDDPILKFRKYLMHKLPLVKIEGIENNLKKQISAEHIKARKNPYPQAGDLLRHVFKP